MSNFIVLSSQRTGSSLVCQWLENVTGVEYLKELPGYKYKKIEGGKIVNTTLEDVEYYKSLSVDNLESYKDSLTKDKIDYAEHADSYPGFFKVQVQYFQNVEKHIINSIDKVYFCERNNLKEQLLSWYFAVRNGWYSETPERNRPARKTLNSKDFEELTIYVNDIVEYHKFKQKVISFAIEYETLIYEDFINKHGKEIEEIEKTPLLVRDGRYSCFLKKQTLWKLEDIIKNWDEFEEWCDKQKEKFNVMERVRI